METLRASIDVTLTTEPMEGQSHIPDGLIGVIIGAKHNKRADMYVPFFALYQPNEDHEEASEVERTLHKRSLEHFRQRAQRLRTG